MLRRVLLLLALGAVALAAISGNNGNAGPPRGPPQNKPGRFLSLPVPEKCAQRELTPQNYPQSILIYIISLCHAGPKQWRLGNQNYFFSGNVSQFAGKKYDWLDARNECREYCMDLVSMESQQENDMVLRFIQQCKSNLSHSFIDFHRYN